MKALKAVKALKEDIQSYTLHANCYVTKPVKLEQFLSVVRTIDEFWLTVCRCPRTEGGSEPMTEGRVLLVEDNPADARLVLERLREARGIRFHTETVARLQEAA